MMGFTESLRVKLNPFGIKAIAILPGSVKTEIFRKANDSDPQTLSRENSVYREYLQKATDFSNAHANSGVSAAKAALVLKKSIGRPGACVELFYWYGCQNAPFDGEILARLMAALGISATIWVLMCRPNYSCQVRVICAY